MLIDTDTFVNQRRDDLLRTASAVRLTRQSRATRPGPSARRMIAGLLLSGLALGTAACGDDDDTATTDTTQAAPADGSGGDAPIPVEPDGGIGDTQQISTEACDAYLEFGAAFAAAPEDPAELGPFGEQLADLLDTIGAGLPQAMGADIEVLTTAAAQVAETGDPSGFFGPDGQQSLTNVGAFAFEGCGGTQVRAEGRDYEYAGIPEELPAGRIDLQFRNLGDEEHEVVILGQPDGVEVDFEALLAGTPDELFSQTTFEGVSFGPPGSTTYLAVDLEPGTYLFLCNIPIGGGEDGLPHHTAGMQQIVEVG